MPASSPPPPSRAFSLRHHPRSPALLLAAGFFVSAGASSLFAKTTYLHGQPKTGRYVDALASCLLRANQRERVTFKQLLGLAQVQYSLLENRFKALATAPDKEVAIKLLDDVRVFMADQPVFLTGWLLQARLSLLVDNPALGLAAGINLSQLRAWETTSPETVKLLETLSAKGWFPKPSPPSLPPEAMAKP
jgi:hypothetical protein